MPRALFQGAEVIEYAGRMGLAAMIRERGLMYHSVPGSLSYCTDIETAIAPILVAVERRVLCSLFPWGVNM